METTLIFEPYRLNGLTLNNGIVMSLITRSCSANVAEALTALYYKQTKN